MKLLLAEDDAMLADALTTQLGGAGFAVEHAANGAVAEYLLSKHSFDIAVLDIGLPMMDGLAVLQHVRQSQPHLPVLLLTALGEVHVLIAGTGGDAAAAEAATLSGVSKVLFADDHAYCHGMGESTAALVAGLVWVMIVSGVPGSDVRWLACVLTIFAGITMVSNVRYYSFKDVNLKKSVPFFVIAVIALGFALVAYSPEIAMFGFFVLYGLSGYVLAVVGRLKRKSP